jgi:lipopolysaccharide biosynthesis glycosyltransferase
MKIIILIKMINFFLSNNFGIFLFNYKESEIENNMNLTDYSGIMGNYSLYSLSDQITILVDGIINWKIDNKSLLNFFDNMKEQTLKDVQIIFILPNDSKYNHIRSSIKKQKIFKIFSPTSNLELDTFNLMNLIRGKFIMILEKPTTFEKNEFEKLISLTHGKIDSIFESQSQNNSLYIIKTKILRNLIDNAQLFNNTKYLINNIISLPKPQLNYISIAICPNDFYVPLTYVSMISILSSKEEFTYISFYLIISKDFQKKNIDLITSLYEQFDYFNITFIEMDERYNDAFISKRMTKQTYFRFSLGELFPFLNRILYLDSDVIIYKDLNKLYNLNFNGKMVLGQVTYGNRNKKTGFFTINNGILLFNLVLMRKMRIEKKVLDILIKKRKKFSYHDQTLMNVYFAKYIGLFPIEYHIRNWGTFKECKDWNKYTGHVYDNDIIYFAQKYPTIRHYLGPNKPIKSEKNHIEDWWFFARKSKYYKQKTSDFDKIFSLDKN